MKNGTTYCLTITESSEWYADLVLTPGLEGEPDEKLLSQIACEVKEAEAFQDGRDVSGEIVYSGNVYKYELRMEFSGDDVAVEEAL